MTMALLVENLTTHYVTEEGIAEAVDDVSFSIEQGEMLGLIGESGSGKTTIAQSILRLLDDTAKVISGKAFINGIDMINAPIEAIEQQRWKAVSVIPQSAMNALNPVMTIGDQIAEAIRLHEQVNKKLALQRTEQLLEKVGISASRRKSYPHEFSGGMKQRVVIAMALACNPKLVISDEATTGLDLLTQAQVLGLLQDLQRQMGLSVLLITHNISVVQAVCDKVIVMYAGKVVEWAAAHQLFANPRHPYTKALMDATPDMKDLKRKVKPIPGNIPALINPPKGCRFQSRCSYSTEQCKIESPEMKEVAPSHFVACFVER